MQAEITEFYVLTECGRTFAWSAVDYSSLMKELVFKGYRAKEVMPLSEYEAEVITSEEQQRLTDELYRAIEELKHSA
ncbi:hypothetical protein ACFQ3J_00220 [Paenibacillus provencensis]|uniref:YhzD-like protein n=1 Tax=Paenibacillus provencensis TaxID=441151 RepID=A0ABW3PPJ2_9BACL